MTLPWNELYPKHTPPTLAQISAYVGTPLWDDLCAHLEAAYAAPPHIEHSICGGAPGWNVKYKKSSRALCTLYPDDGWFTCLVSIGQREAMEAELLLTNCTAPVRALYARCKPYNGSRWLMIPVTSADILTDAKMLIATRLSAPAVRPKQPQAACACAPAFMHNAATDTPQKDANVFPSNSAAPAQLAAWVDGLRNSDAPAAYACFLQLQALCETSSALCGFFDCLAALVESPSAYERTRGLLLLAACAPWDSENRLETMLDEYLAHVTDEKPTVARQFIAVLPKLARQKPSFAPDIRRALQQANPARYRDSMAGLVQKDIAAALQALHAAQL